MLQLRIGFPTGRYLAAGAADPRLPEWPPHPSRVYSALVAAAYAGGAQPSDDERRALRFLEAAPAPALDFPDADTRPAPDAYVPVNDEDSRLGTKSLGVLHPNRQQRQFPAAYLLDEPTVRLGWPVTIDPTLLQALDAMASRVTHIGTSHSFATARFETVEASFRARLTPRQDGETFLRVPVAGRLDELDALVARRAAVLRRPQPLCEVLTAYGPSAAPARGVVDSAYDWVVLRLADAAWGTDTAHTLARAARRAVLSLLGEHAPAAVHGHDLTVPHLAWLPLGDVGHPHARGSIRGLGIALPKTMPAQERAVALAGLARLQSLRLPDGQVARLTPSIDAPETPLVLRSSTWRRAATHWSTVTPVLLDRPPKRADTARAASALVESIVLAGFPPPIRVHLSPTSDFEGAPSVTDVPSRLPKHHARVVFAEPVVGPVIAGRWKNFGVGLFRPTPTELRG